MAMQAASVHSRPANLEHSPGDSGAKKNENDFDSAFDLAMFAIPASFAIPPGANNAVFGSRNAADSSSAEGADVSVTTGSKSETESSDGSTASKSAQVVDVASLGNSSRDLAVSSDFDDSSASGKLIANNATGANLSDSAFAATIEIVYHAQSPLAGGNAAASASKPSHATSRSTIAAADGASHESAADAIAAAVSAEQAQASSNQPSALDSSGAHSKPSARSNPASSDRTAEFASTASSASSASTNTHQPAAQALSSSTIASAIQQAADDAAHPGIVADEKHADAQKTNSDATLVHSSNADGPITASTSNAPAIIGTGSSQPASSVAPTLRVVADPVVEARIASLTIDLASGQSTHATIREHAGAVDVRIVAASQQSANAISSELPALRRALDAAGMQLKAADVSHHGDSQGGQRGHHQGNPPARRESADSTTFVLGEVN